MSSENKPRSAFARFFGRGKKETSDSYSDPVSQELLDQNSGAEDTGAVIMPAVDEQPISNELELEAVIPENEFSRHKEPSKLIQDNDGKVNDERADGDSEDPSIRQTPKKGLFARWRSGLGKTRSGLGSAFGALLGGRRKIDEDLIEEIETLLVSADVGIDTTAHLIELFREKVKQGIEVDQDLMSVFRGLLSELLQEHAQPLILPVNKLGVVMMVGVNGVGKTTSIGKLAKRLQGQGKSVMLAAGDTFRAAAVEQLEVWGQRNQVSVVAQATGSDSASVIYDALDSAKAKQFDVLIADTAGRLHNKSNLMDELTKVVRVAKKLDESAPHEILLVLDAATGQNALNQARAFCKSVPVTGLILTKLDGTAKGGIVFSLVQQLKLPVKFVGLGEGIDDLAEFNPGQFIDALFDQVDAG